MKNPPRSSSPPHVVRARAVVSSGPKKMIRIRMDADLQTGPEGTGAFTAASPAFCGQTPFEEKP